MRRQGRRDELGTRLGQDAVLSTCGLCLFMLLALLGVPSQALPLAELKQILTEKAASVGASTGAGLIGGSAVTKPLYGCVAKRLLKIERGTREQVVKFDL